MKKQKTQLLILTYKYSEGLMRLFKSLRAVNYPSDLITVIMNGVDKDQYKHAFNFCESWNYRILSWPDNLGFFRAFNNGIMSISPTDYFVLLNDDIEIRSEEWLDYLYGEMNELVGMVGIKQRMEGPNNPLDDRRIMSCCLLNPEAVRKTGLFDERYWEHFGDIEYICRMHSFGYRIKSIETSSIYHEIGQTYKKSSLGILKDAWRFSQFLTSNVYEWRERLIDYPVQDIRREVDQLLNFELQRLDGKGNNI